MYLFIESLIDLIKFWDDPDPSFRWLYGGTLVVIVLFWIIRRWWKARARERAQEQINRFYVVSKNPDSIPFVPSSIAPSMMDSIRTCRVKLRFDPKRENYHPDDNSIILTCPAQLYERIREGTYGKGIWKGEELISFTPEEQNPFASEKI